MLYEHVEPAVWLAKERALGRGDPAQTRLGDVATDAVYESAAPRDDSQGDEWADKGCECAGGAEGGE